MSVHYLLFTNTFSEGRGGQLFPKHSGEEIHIYKYEHVADLAGEQGAGEQHKQRLCM